MHKRLLISIGCLVLLVFAPSALASNGFVQATSGSTSGATLKVSYSPNVKANDLLVGEFRATGTTSVSDSVNGSWTEAAQTTNEGVTHSLWYAQNAKAGATTVTVSGSSSASLRAVIAEYSGVATSGALDKTACNQGTSTSVTTGATASVAAGELLFAGVGAFEHPITVTAGSSNGVSATLRTQFTGTNGTSAEEDVTSTASGAQNASFTLSASAPGGWAACVATFHPAEAPVNTGLPVLSGTAQQGSTLTTTNGTWSNSPTSYAYAWKRCSSSGEACTTIWGATSSAYTLQEADIGHKVRSAVTASNSAGEGTATSAASAEVKAPEGTITMDGSGAKPLYEEWASISDKIHCAVETSSTNVPDERISLETTGVAATSSDKRSIHFKMPTGDGTGAGACFTGRSELAAGNPTKAGFPGLYKDGQEVWIAFEILLPKTFPLNSSALGAENVFQLHETAGPGSPPMDLTVGRDPECCTGAGTPHPGGEVGYMGVTQENNAEPGFNRTTVTVSENILPNTWYKVVLHVKFSEANTGFLYMYLGKEAETPVQVYSRTNSDMEKTGYTPTHARIGLYPGIETSVAAEDYIAGYTAGTTRAVVEASAF